MMRRGFRQKSTEKHSISWCYYCGWTHGVLDSLRVEENGNRIIRPICKECQKNLKHMVHCAVCGLKPGDNLYYTTIEWRQLEDGSTCNIVVNLCDKCRHVPQEEVLKKLQIPDICDKCEKRYACYTQDHREPDKSYLDTRSGLYKNPKVNFRW